MTVIIDLFDYFLTAQDISENVWRESKKYHFKGSVMSMDDYDVRKLIDEEVVIFICSTTGQGGIIVKFNFINIITTILICR